MGINCTDGCHKGGQPLASVSRSTPQLCPGTCECTVCVLIGWGVTASDLPLLGEGAAGKKGCSAGDDRREEDADRLKTSNPLL